MPLYVVDTVQDEPLTVRVEDRPPCENIPSGWQTQVESPASSMLEQHFCAPLLPPLLLLLLHAPTSPANRTTQADVIRFIDPDPFRRSAQHLTCPRSWLGAPRRRARSIASSPPGDGGFARRMNGLAPFAFAQRPAPTVQ